jgi:hypothetical protein
MHFSRFALLPVLALLAGCQAMAEYHVAGLINPKASPAGFDVCHGSSCHVRTRVALTDAQWDRVRAEFAENRDAVEERADVREAIGLMERLVAKPTGTATDVGDNKYARDQSTQLDCVDEAVNSTTYLRMIADDGLLRFHAVELPAHRGGMRYAHNTAVIRDAATGRRFAVDSSFFDNGNPAVVLPLDTWLAGWRPGDSVPSLAEQSDATVAPVVAICCGGGSHPEEFTVTP